MQSKALRLRGPFTFAPMLFPEIEADGLRLRKPVSTDLGQVYKGLSDERVVAQYGISYKSKAEAKVQMDYYDYVWENEEGIYWAICKTGEKDLIGVVGLYNYLAESDKAECGIWLFPDHWGKGIATQALTQALRWGFSTLALHRVEAMTEPGNARAERLLTRLNFVHEGTMRETEYKNNTYISLNLYGLLKKEAVLG